MSVSYEVYAYKGGKWAIDSVYDDRDMALYEARLLLNSRFLKAVQVVEERYNDNTMESTTKVIFRQRKAGEAPKPKNKRPQKKPGERIRTIQPRKKKEKKKMSMGMYLTLMSVLIGGIGMGLIFLMVYLLETVAKQG